MMPRKTLIDRFVASVRSPTRQNYFDTKVRGLALRVTPRGVKSWYFVYRLDGQPSQWLAIGSYPALTLAAARVEALSHRKAVDVERRDPVAEKHAADKAAAEKPADSDAAAAEYTFADLAKLYLTFAKRKKKTWHDDDQKIRKYLVPAWGELPLRDITRGRVHELLDTLAADGMTVGVNRVQAVISRLFTIALDRSLIDAHPAARMEKRFEEQARTRVLTDDELRQLCAALEAAETAASDAVWLRLLLGQRGEETAGMLWAELDLTTGVWSLDGQRTKNKRPHVVALPPAALAIVNRRRTVVGDDDPRVFPGLSLTAPEHKALSAIHGGAYQWTDLRRTVATRLAGLGFDETTIGRVLNHARYGVTGKHYNQHAYLEEIRRALLAWNVELDRILANKPKPKATVLPMPPR
jgi:integrase